MKVFHQDQIVEAAKLIQQGVPVAFPTETVYGLGAIFSDEVAVRKIFDLKGRPLDNPLICHIADFEQIFSLAREVPLEAMKLAEAFWPGPLTMVLKRKHHIPDCVTAGLDTVAIRMPSHPVARRLIRAVQHPLVGPSANLSGRPSSTKAQHVIHDFAGKECAVVDGGESEEGVESTVIYLASTPPLILRYGLITVESISKILNVNVATAVGKELKASPGTRYRHYAPQARVSLYQSFDAIELKSGKKYFFASTASQEGYHLLKPSNLYDLLRKADEMQCEEIVIVCLEKQWGGLALQDRLFKAAGREVDRS